MDYLATALEPTQTERATPEQVENSAGGFAWKVDRWARLRRFLILGSEGGTYYASERDATRENLTCLSECVDEDGRRVVRELVSISEGGRAPKNDPALFALAYVAANGMPEDRRAALDALPRVARIGTHLFTFCGYVDRMRGWGRALRRAVGAWYLDRDPANLALQLVKYRQRNGWTHRDVLRLSHPKPGDVVQDALFGWATHPEDYARRDLATDPGGKTALVVAHVEAQRAETPSRSARLIREHGLPRECIRTEHLAEREVWEALLEGMPMTAMIRNLGNMSKVGLLTPSSRATAAVLGRLGDRELITGARVHPIQVLSALTTYARGQGARGHGEWTVVPQIVDALDGAFELAFGNVRPSGRRVHLALDVSGSMSWGEIAAIPGLTPRVGSAAMALVTARTEPLYSMGAFTRTYQQLAISAGSHLRDVISAISGLEFGGTDCALPMLWAEREGAEIDLFVIYTDSETWAGSVHPFEALKRYRRSSGIDAKLCVVGMVSNGFSIADPNDAGMLDVVGFDTATPAVISQFAEGF